MNIFDLYSLTILPILLLYLLIDNNMIVTIIATNWIIFI